MKKIKTYIKENYKIIIPISLILVLFASFLIYYKVAILNNITRKFPDNIVAKIHHVKIKPFFDGKDMQDDNNNDFKF